MASEKGFIPRTSSWALTFGRGPDGGEAGQGGQSAGQAEISQKIILTSHCLLPLSGELKGGKPHQPLPTPEGSRLGRQEEAAAFIVK